MPTALAPHCWMTSIKSAVRIARLAPNQIAECDGKLADKGEELARRSGELQGCVADPREERFSFGRGLGAFLFGNCLGEFE